MRNITCPIWGTPAVGGYDGNRDGLNALSARTAGAYYITGSAAATIEESDPAMRARLTTWLIEQRRLGVERPEVLSDTVDNVLKQEPLPVQVRADRLLQYMAKATPHVSSPFELPHDDENDVRCLEAQAWSESVGMDEVLFLCDYLEEQGWLREHMHTMGSQSYRLSVQGHAHLAELIRDVSESSQAFVAMWFNKSMRRVRDEGIVPGIEDAGYVAMVIDQKEHINRIDDEIVTEIRRSRFLVADFTHGESGARGSVYYEAGLADGLEIPVVSTCRADMIEEVSFDRRQYNHLLWEEEALEDLRKRLGHRIVELIGEGPRRAAGGFEQEQP